MSLVLVSDLSSVDKLLANSSSATFLADQVNKPKRLKKFRDKCFPTLQDTDRDDAQLKARLKHLNNVDLQQCVGLLRNDSVKAWLQNSYSSLLWINSYRGLGIADWVSAFSTRLVEHAGRLPEMTVLYHFCGNHSTSRRVSTATVVVQSLIIQILQLYHKKFSRKVFPFTLEHFRDAQDDFEDLWNLFVECCAEAQVTCVWLIVDHIDNLKKGENYDALLTSLKNLTEEDSKIFKVFLSARSTGTPSIMQSASTNSIDETVQPLSQIFTVTVPRAQTRTSAALLSKQKRLVRIPDAFPEQTPLGDADIAELLGSSSDDLLSEKDTNVDARDKLVASPVSLTSPKGLKSSDMDEGTDISDSSLDFVKENPFATSSESEWERRLPSIGNGSKNENILESDDDEEDLAFARGPVHDEPTRLSDSSASQKTKKQKKNSKKERKETEYSQTSDKAKSRSHIKLQDPLESSSDNDQVTSKSKTKFKKRIRSRTKVDDSLSSSANNDLGEIEPHAKAKQERDDDPLASFSSETSSSAWSPPKTKANTRVKDSLLSSPESEP